MKPFEYLPEDELIEKGIAALMEALGPIEATRFLTLSRGLRLESVERHRRWQAELNKQEFFDLVFGEGGLKTSDHE